MATSLLVDSYRLSMAGYSNQTNLPLALHNYATANVMLQTSTSTAFSDANKQSVIFENTATYGPGISGNEVTGANYVARGSPLTATIDVTQAAHVCKLVGVGPVWATATITATGMYIVGQTGAAAAGSTPAMGYWDFGGSVASTAGTFTVTQPAAGWYTVT